MCSRSASWAFPLPSRSMSQRFHRRFQALACDRTRLWKSSAPPDVLWRRGQGFADGVIARRVEGHDLLHPDRSPLRARNREDLSDEPAPADDLPGNIQGLFAPEDPGPGGLSHDNSRLDGLNRQEDGRFVEPSAAHVLQVAVSQLRVPRNALVPDRSVEGGTHVDGPRPVLRREDPLDGGKVGLSHVDDAPARQEADPSVLFPEPYAPFQHAALEVQHLTVFEDFAGLQAEPRPPGMAEGQAEPVGPVDEVLVFDDASLHPALQTVVPPRQIGAWVVRAAGPRLLARAAGGEATVAQGAQGLAQGLRLRVPSLVDEMPRIHRVPSSTRPVRASRKRSTSSVSRRL